MEDIIPESPTRLIERRKCTNWLVRIYLQMSIEENDQVTKDLVLPWLKPRLLFSYVDQFWFIPTFLESQNTTDRGGNTPEKSTQ